MTARRSAYASRNSSGSAPQRGDRMSDVSVVERGLIYLRPAILLDKRGGRGGAHGCTTTIEDEDQSPDSRYDCHGHPRRCFLRRSGFAEVRPPSQRSAQSYPWVSSFWESPRRRSGAPRPGSPRLHLFDNRFDNCSVLRVVHGLTVEAPMRRQTYIRIAFTSNCVHVGTTRTEAA